MATSNVDSNLSVLLQCINVMPPNSNACRLEDLNTGFRIWEILKHLDPTSDAFSGELPEMYESSSNWVWRWQNLKHVSKALDRYAIGNGQSIPRGLDVASVNLKSVADGDDTDRTELLKFLKMFIYTASICSMKASEITAQSLQTLDEDAQTLIKEMLLEMLNNPSATSELESDSKEILSHSRMTDVPEMDQALLYEQRLGKVTAERDTLLRDRQDLQKELREIDNRHSRLQENNEILQQRLIDAEDRLVEGQGRGSEESTIRKLENRIQHQEDIIAGQEAQLSENQERLDSLDKEAYRLRKETDRIQPLQDELDETKVQRDNYAKRANMADKYQQKLQDYSELEKENQLLKGELEEARFEKGDGSSARTQIAGLQKTIDESRVLVSTIEIHRYELQGMLKQMELDNGDLQQERDDLKEQLLKAQEQIAESRTGRSGSPLENVGTGLDSEMENSERLQELEAMPAEERSKKLFKDLEDTKAELFMHKHVAEDRQTRFTELEKRYEALSAEKIVLERNSAKTELSDMPNSPQHGDKPGFSSSNGESAVSESQYLAKEAEVNKLQERIKAMEAENPSLKKMADAALMKQELKVTRLENRLMSTAWYDLNRRTHMNNVIVQRKCEPPRGPLKAAREMSDRAMAVRAR